MIVTTAANATAYSDTGLAEGTTYFYRVRAANEWPGIRRTPTRRARRHRFPFPWPLPTLSATAASSSQINLTWTDQSTNETAFRDRAENRGRRDVRPDRDGGRQRHGIQRYRACGRDDVLLPGEGGQRVQGIRRTPTRRARRHRLLFPRPPPTFSHSGLVVADQPDLDGSIHERNGLPDRAEDRGRRDIRPDRHGGRQRHGIQRHRPCGRNDVLLPGEGGQRCREFGVLQRGERDNAILRNKWEAVVVAGGDVQSQLKENQRANLH